MSLNDLQTLPGVTAQPDSATAQFVFNHTMLRVKNIEKSLDFYTRVLGFRVVDKRDFPAAEFSLYFLALVDPAHIPVDDAARHQWMKSIPGVLELTHNYGTEKDPEFAYHDGNTDPRGFGHICVSVPDVRVACERFEALGVPFQKRLQDGRPREDEGRGLHQGSGRLLGRGDPTYRAQRLTPAHTLVGAGNFRPFVVVHSKRPLHTTTAR